MSTADLMVQLEAQKRELYRIISKASLDDEATVGDGKPRFMGMTLEELTAVKPHDSFFGTDRTTTPFRFSKDFVPSEDGYTFTLTREGLVDLRSLLDAADRAEEIGLTDEMDRLRKDAAALLTLTGGKL